MIVILAGAFLVGLVSILFLRATTARGGVWAVLLWLALTVAAALLVGILEPNTYADSGGGMEPIFTNRVWYEVLVFVISALCLLGIGVGAGVSAVVAARARRRVDRSGGETC